jgi:hypothetical protein
VIERESYSIAPALDVARVKKRGKPG